MLTPDNIYLSFIIRHYTDFLHGENSLLDIDCVQLYVFLFYL